MPPNGQPEGHEAPSVVLGASDLSIDGVSGGNWRLEFQIFETRIETFSILRVGGGGGGEESIIFAPRGLEERRGPVTIILTFDNYHLLAINL